MAQNSWKTARSTVYAIFEIKSTIIQYIQLVEIIDSWADCLCDLIL
jgi:hypothetical protein